eukprot:tig00000403_g287.t1
MADEAALLRALETGDVDLLAQLLSGNSVQDPPTTASTESAKPDLPVPVGNGGGKRDKPARPSPAPAASPAAAADDQAHLNVAAKPFVPSTFAFSAAAPAFVPRGAPEPAAASPALAQLQEMFPAAGAESLEAALEAARGDLSEAVAGVLASEGAEVEAQFEETDALYGEWSAEHAGELFVDEAGRPVDPAAVRYDEQGQPYVLEYLPLDGPFSAAGAPGPRFTEEEFPSLGGPGGAAAPREPHAPPAQQQQEGGRPSALVAKLRLQKLREQVPWVSPEAVAGAFDEHRCSFVAARSALLAHFPKPPDWDKRHAAAAQGPRPGASSPGSGGPASRSSGVPRRWVATGDSVASMYSDLREEARRCALMRNQCFMNATKAFLSGNKALAKDLGHQGRQWNAKMKDLHERAAADIFALRNAGSSDMLDLHGLHVKEALSVLEDALEDWRSRGGGTFQVITGSGHHSSSVQRLRPAVERFLQGTRGVRYTQLPDKNRHVGMLEIHVSS